MAILEGIVNTVLGSRPLRPLVRYAAYSGFLRHLDRLYEGTRYSDSTDVVKIVRQERPRVTPRILDDEERNQIRDMSLYFSNVSASKCLQVELDDARTRVVDGFMERLPTLQDARREARARTVKKGGQKPLRYVAGLAAFGGYEQHAEVTKLVKEMSLALVNAERDSQ